MSLVVEKSRKYTYRCKMCNAEVTKWIEKGSYFPSYCFGCKQLMNKELEKKEINEND